MYSVCVGGSREGMGLGDGVYRGKCVVGAREVEGLYQRPPTFPLLSLFFSSVPRRVTWMSSMNVLCLYSRHVSCGHTDRFS